MKMKREKQIIGFLAIVFLMQLSLTTHSQKPAINEKEYYETRGLNVIVFTNWYNGAFGDEKMSGIEIIHHETRTATNGDVRLEPTPEQWDPVPTFNGREVDRENGIIEARLSYPGYEFDYTVKTRAANDGLLVSVTIDKPLPEELVGKAAFHIEFLPAAYFEKAYLMDGKPGTFPLYPSGPMTLNDAGEPDPLPLASGMKLVLAPEDTLRRVTVESLSGKLWLYDGRNKAQNGWLVLRTLIPENKTGKVVEWKITANTVENWVRKPVIAHSQLGYHPDQPKKAIVELDKNDTADKTAQLIRISENGQTKVVKSAPLDNWGGYLRYHYKTFNFSEVKEEGVYCIRVNDVQTAPFCIAADVYDNVWQPALDVFMAVQMDHMLVNEAYRIWHGKSHMDDALQAPVNHTHFDMYAQGPTTDTPYEPGEHIPGLNIGGWFDAGDFDIRTQTQYHTVMQMVHAWEDFNIESDETLIDQERRYVDIHYPDGKPDLLQQIEHGTLGLIAQHRACGHAIPGIIAPDISQYTHLGDAGSKTDNLVYNPSLSELDNNGFESGIFDDRWAFTSRSTALNYGSAAGLAAAARALKGYNDELAAECIETAQKVWDEEHAKEPDIFRVGNTTGGNLLSEELTAAVELLATTGEAKYANRIEEIFNSPDTRFMFMSTLFVRAIPNMPGGFKSKVKEKLAEMLERMKQFGTDNPFGVPITRGGWAGGGTAMNHGISHYLYHKAFPDLVPIDAVFDGLNYILGCHPGSDISFVSGVGTVSKKVAYGNNRADYSFIAGGVVPGVIILPPDFPENKEDWPFLWGENEYVIPMSVNYMYLVHAVKDILGR
ncbi:MAG: glycoside hydrolase family 9 protein [Prolixibacteraceae bacterium]|nr:glycoside hydrolase family 9 protein [Prolixibacteraceae bacterium]